MLWKGALVEGATGKGLTHLDGQIRKCSLQGTIRMAFHGKDVGLGYTYLAEGKGVPLNARRAEET